MDEKVKCSHCQDEGIIYAEKKDLNGKLWPNIVFRCFCITGQELKHAYPIFKGRLFQEGYSIQKRE